MNYKEYQKALKAIDKKYNGKRKAVYDLIQKIEHQALKDGRIYPDDKKRLDDLYKEAEFLKDKQGRSIERLKMNFISENAKVKTGDIIWAVKKGTTKVMRVEYAKLSAFEYPMLKYFGTQLTLYGQPCKKQLEHPKGGIYEKDITSINGEPFEYKILK